MVKSLFFCSFTHCVQMHEFYSIYTAKSKYYAFCIHWQHFIQWIRCIHLLSKLLNYRITIIFFTKQLPIFYNVCNFVTFHFQTSPAFPSATFPICPIDSSLTYIYFYRLHVVIYYSTHGPRKITFQRFVFDARYLWNQSLKPE